MDSAVVVAVVMSSGAALAAVVGGYYTYAAARRNTSATREMERDKLSTSSWEAQVAGWRADVLTLRQLRSEDEARQSAAMRDAQASIRGCMERIESLTHRIDVMERYEVAVVRWARAVIRIMQDAHLTFPRPPPGINGTDNGE